MNAHYPDGYIKYVKICKSLEVKPNPNFVKFATRYKFAGQLESIQVHGYSELTQQIYLESLRVSLAYSALESLNKTIGSKVITSLKEAELSEEYKSSTFSKLRHFLEVSCEPKLVNRLNNLSSSKKNSDLLPVIEAIRHLTFHGVLNPTNSGLSNQTALSFLQKLSYVLFQQMDKQSISVSSQLLIQLK